MYLSVRVQLYAASALVPASCVLFAPAFGRVVTTWLVTFGCHAFEKWPPHSRSNPFAVEVKVSSIFEKTTLTLREVERFGLGGLLLTGGGRSAGAM